MPHLRPTFPEVAGELAIIGPELTIDEVEWLNAPSGHGVVYAFSPTQAQSFAPFRSDGLPLSRQSSQPASPTYTTSRASQGGHPDATSSASTTERVWTVPVENRDNLSSLSRHSSVGGAIDIRISSSNRHNYPYAGKLRHSSASMR